MGVVMGGIKGWVSIMTFFYVPYYCMCITTLPTHSLCTLTSLALSLSVSLAVCLSIYLSRSLSVSLSVCVSTSAKTTNSFSYNFCQITWTCILPDQNMNFCQIKGTVVSFVIFSLSTCLSAVLWCVCRALGRCQVQRCVFVYGVCQWGRWECAGRERKWWSLYAERLRWSSTRWETDR